MNPEEKTPMPPTILILLLLSILTYGARRLFLTFNTSKPSIVNLLLLKAKIDWNEKYGSDRYYNQQDPMPYYYGDNKKGLIVEYLTKSIHAHDIDINHPYETVEILNSFILPTKFLDKIDAFRSNLDYSQFFYNESPAIGGVSFSVGKLVDINYRRNPLNQLNSIIAQIEEEGNRIVSNYHDWISA